MKKSTKMDICLWLAIYAALNFFFFFVYTLELSKGYEASRKLCGDDVKYRIEYMLFPISAPTCFLLKRIK